MEEKEEIRCPNCGKLLAKKDKDKKICGIYLYCKVCKKEIRITCNCNTCKRAIEP